MSIPAVEFEQVSFTYAGNSTPALENISLRVEQGERLGILGPNGGGKSTLIKLTLGLLDGHSGTIRVLGMSPQQARRAGIIGYVPQKPKSELGLPLSARQVVELGAGWRCSPFRRLSDEVRSRVERMIELTGVKPYADRPIGKLSGGQIQRVLIARALSADTKILALDEPTVGIDASGQQMFAELLDKVHQELGLTILVISHDIRAIAAGSDRVACLARKLHSHTSPQGLTPQILAELFAHDIAGLPGALAGMHLHAHSLDQPCHDPSHVHTPMIAPASLSISAKHSAGKPQESGGDSVARAENPGRGT